MPEATLCSTPEPCSAREDITVVKTCKSPNVPGTEKRICAYAHKGKCLSNELERQQWSQSLSLHATDPGFIARIMISPNRNYQLWCLCTDMGTNTEHISYNFNTLPQKRIYLHIFKRLNFAIFDKNNSMQGKMSQKKEDNCLLVVFFFLVNLLNISFIYFLCGAHLVLGLDSGITHDELKELYVVPGQNLGLPFARQVSGLSVVLSRCFH